MLAAARCGPLPIQGHITSGNDTVEDIIRHTTPQQQDLIRRLGDTHVLSDHEGPSPFGAMAWTGPSMFTDSVLSYLLARYSFDWRELRGLTRPLRVGDVLILPRGGFSGSEDGE